MTAQPLAGPPITTHAVIENLELVHPAADDFHVYGYPEAARAWALEHRYLLAERVAPCAHGLYGMAMCPATTCGRYRASFLDHANVWVPDPFGWTHISKEFFGDRPFVLAHPYGVDESEVAAYARPHGLRYDIHPPGSGAFLGAWYEGAYAVRLTVPDHWPVWPIERLAAVLLVAHPQRWPEVEA